MYKLRCGDCLDILPEMEAGSMDAIITDPPFGIDFHYARYDDNPESYPALMKDVIHQSNRICHEGIKAFWQALPNLRKWGEWFDFDYRMIAICKGFVQYRPTDIQWSFDPVIFWGHTGKEPSVYYKDYFIQAKAPFGANREKIDHPCPRPLEAMIYLIEIFSNPGETILDPFMGSGTTGVACMQLGRNFIGYEIDPTYYAIAEKRIKQAQMQMLLPLEANAEADRR